MLLLIEIKSSQGMLMRSNEKLHLQGWSVWSWCWANEVAMFWRGCAKWSWSSIVNLKASWCALSTWNMRRTSRNVSFTPRSNPHIIWPLLNLIFLFSSGRRWVWSYWRDESCNNQRFGWFFMCLMDENHVFGVKKWGKRFCVRDDIDDVVLGGMKF